MLVYGDREAHEASRRRIERLRPGLAGTDPSAMPLERDSALETLFVEAAELAQGLAEMEIGVRRVVTDNRLHRCEWLRLPNGCLMKTDALDHAAAHDLIDCQDIAWDVAGGLVEFDLSEAQAGTLCRSVEGDVPLDRRLLAFCIPCYIAFQIGYWTFATGSDPSAAGERRRYEEQWNRMQGKCIGG